VKVLGVHDGHNASVCLMIDGRIRLALQEERIRRIKNCPGFPEKALGALFEREGLGPGDIDLVAFNGRHMPPAKDRREVIAEYSSSDSSLSHLKKLLKKTSVDKFYQRRRREERLERLLALGFHRKQVEFVDHHYCHAAAAYHGFGKYDGDVLVLTNDGAGDRICATVNIGRNGKLERIAQVAEEHSIATLYAFVTHYCGMVPLEHEYKLMGMAPYADQRLVKQVFEDLRQYYEFDPDNPLLWHRANGMPHAFHLYGFLRKKFELVRFDGVMGGVQALIEDILTQWVRNAVRLTGIRTVALSGGIFMNVKANKRIMELDEVDELFVFPSCGDETNAIGACYAKTVESLGHQAVRPIGEFTLGPDFADEAIESALKRFRFSNSTPKVTRPPDIEEKVAELIAAGQVVSRFAGREEFGARALGNRSILADPSKTAVIREINDMIKNRDFWMPFAASILEEDAERYLINPKGIPSPYMILSFDTTAAAEEISAGTHPYDRTCRPQIVKRDWNPSYHALIESFKKRTGIGAVLNTSFNLHGFPLVHSPEDALDVFDRSGLRHLAIGSFLVQKT